MRRPCELLGPIARRMAARAPCSRYLRRVPLQMSNRMVFLQLHWHPSLRKRKEPLYRDGSPVTAVQMVVRRCSQRIPLLVKNGCALSFPPFASVSLLTRWLMYSTGATILSCRDWRSLLTGSNPICHRPSGMGAIEHAKAFVMVRITPCSQNKNQII